PGRCAVGAAVEGAVDAQITADLDAGVGTRDEEEACAVKRADPDIFDCLGLDRKVGRLCPADGDQACRGAENECSRRSHLVKSPVLRFMQLHAAEVIQNSLLRMTRM